MRSILKTISTWIYFQFFHILELLDFEILVVRHCGNPVKSAWELATLKILCRTEVVSSAPIFFKVNKVKPHARSSR